MSKDTKKIDQSLKKDKQFLNKTSRNFAKWSKTVDSTLDDARTEHFRIKSENETILRKQEQALEL